MARTESNYKLSLYFCNVKSYRRHEVAAKCSVFRASILLGLTYTPNECGSSNARKGLACDTLTARIGVFYFCQNYGRQ